jgi:hypothetical protein
VTAKCLHERLEAAGDDAAQDPSLDDDVADARCPLDAADRRHADEADLDSLHQRPFRHDHDAKQPSTTPVRNPAVARAY